MCVCVTSHRGVFPVAYDLLQVLGWVQQEVFSPLVPVHHHGPVNVHAGAMHIDTDTHSSVLTYGFSCFYVITDTKQVYGSECGPKLKPLQYFQRVLWADVYTQFCKRLLDFRCIDAACHHINIKQTQLKRVFFFFFLINLLFLF